MSEQSRPFLKWAGGKMRLLERIRHHLPTTQSVLVEPFVGAGAVFMNLDFEQYVINDANADLINLYDAVKVHGKDFIVYSKQFFSPFNNNPRRFYQLRRLFNHTEEPIIRSALFLYLNRHGFNGLCRYNQQGGFNVPFGRYRQPYFPEKELLHFLKRSTRVELHCGDFGPPMRKATEGHVIYCDPPYVPLSPTANFTDYHHSRFDDKEQLRLARLARTLAKRGVPVLLSNHDVAYTRKLYNTADLTHFSVRRNISCDSKNRQKVSELLALFR